MVRKVFLMSVLALALVANAGAMQNRILRSRYLEARPEALRAVNRPGDVMPLRLFSDRSYEAVLEELEDHRLNGLVWRGHLVDHVNSWVVMVEHKGVMAGVISTGDSVFRVRFAGAGLHVIEEMDPASLSWSGDDAVVPDLLSSPAGLAAQSESSGAAEAAEAKITEIDVLMVYTRKAGKRLVKNKSKYWWVEETDAKKAIESQAMLSIAVANSALKNSKIKAVFRVVGVKKIKGKGSGDFSKDLDRMKEPADGFMDKAHVLRDRFGADFVVLILGRFEKDFGGRGFVIPASHPRAPDLAFSVVRSSALWWTIVAHEIGHNMGLVHDPGHDSLPPFVRSHSFARGYRDEPKGLATVMAYVTGCSACWLSIPHYSNPKVRWQGGSQPIDSNLLQPTCKGEEPPGFPEIAFPVCGTRTGAKKFNSAKSINKNKEIFAAYQDCKVDCQPSE